MARSRDARHPATLTRRQEQRRFGIVFAVSGLAVLIGRVAPVAAGSPWVFGLHVALVVAVAAATRLVLVSLFLRHPESRVHPVAPVAMLILTFAILLPACDGDCSWIFVGAHCPRLGPLGAG